MEDGRMGGGSRVRVGDAMICAESQHTIFGKADGRRDKAGQRGCRIATDQRRRGSEREMFGRGRDGGCRWRRGRGLDREI